MHEGRLHVTPETGTTGTFVPSNRYIRGASATSSGISAAMAGSQFLVGFAPGFIASMALPFGLAIPEAVTGPVCRSPLMAGVVLFGLIGFGLNVYDLYLGLRLRTRCHDLSECAEKILFAHADSRDLMLGVGIPLRASDGQKAIYPALSGTDHEYGGDDHGHETERPGPNRAPAGA
jgi:hypothetical protein